MLSLGFSRRVRSDRAYRRPNQAGLAQPVNCEAGYNECQLTGQFKTNNGQPPRCRWVGARPERRILTDGYNVGRLSR